ncbi:MAG TPA: hypothetical protein VFA63_15390 [Pseudonocardiaceae bacterium]|jgi:hypothetical protein|nr:hypothetical protein [Pseudonocardiaceae bacterium]
MALDWDAVVARYKDGAEVAPIPGASTLAVTGADETKVYVKHRLWKDSLSRTNLEKAVALLEQGKMTRRSGDFVDQYRTFVADERPTTAATVLKDLGFLE